MYSHAGAIIPDEVVFELMLTPQGVPFEGVKEFWDMFEGVLNGTATEPVENPFN
jgi:hypothetical protein